MPAAALRRGTWQPLTRDTTVSAGAVGITSRPPTSWQSRTHYRAFSVDLATFTTTGRSTASAGREALFVDVPAFA